MFFIVTPKSLEILSKVHVLHVQVLSKERTDMWPRRGGPTETDGGRDGWSPMVGRKELFVHKQ